MFDSITPELQVESMGNDVSYILPVRPLGRLLWFGLVPVVFSIVWMWIPGHSLVEFLQRLVAGHHDAGEWLFVAFLLPTTLAGLLPLFMGLMVVAGRCRVDWRDQRLSVLDYAGPIRWRRRMPRKAIRKLVVKTGGARVNDRPVTGWPLAELGALQVEFDEGKPRQLIVGYPRELLQRLAADLSMHVGASTSAEAMPQVEVTDLNLDRPEFADVAEPPLGSRVTIQRRVNGIGIEVPPAGLWKGSKGLLFFGIFWCLFMALVTGLSVFGTGNSFGGPSLDFWLFIPVFWLIGLGLLAGAVNMGRRRATLSVAGGTLVVETHGVFGIKRREWHRNELSSIRADRSGMEVNKVPVIELQVHPVRGKKTGLLAGRPDEELRWMATELRRAMDLPAARPQN